MIEEENNKQQPNETGETVDTTTDYIAAINQLKKNTVDRKVFEQLKAENKSLLEAVVNGQSVEAPKKEAPVNIQELRNKTFKEGISNLEFATNALELRKALIESGENDPFLPFGKKIVSTNEDVEAANRVAKTIQECIDYAEGDNDAFTNELMRRTVDTGPRRK